MSLWTEMSKTNTYNLTITKTNELHGIWSCFSKVWAYHSLLHWQLYCIGLCSFLKARCSFFSLITVFQFRQFGKEWPFAKRQPKQKPSGVTNFSNNVEINNRQSSGTKTINTRAPTPNSWRILSTMMDKSTHPKQPENIGHHDGHRAARGSYHPHNLVWLGEDGGLTIGTVYIRRIPLNEGLHKC